VVERLDRDTVARILRRAAELHDDDAVVEDGIDEVDLIAAAEEVGLSAAAVRESLAIERLGAEPQRSALEKMVGPKTVWADRIVAASVDEVMRRLDMWLVAGHHLRRERAADDSGEWRKRSDLAAAVQRALRGLSGEARLGEARLVRARAARVDAGRSIVRVTIDRQLTANLATAGIGVVGGAGVVGAAAGAVLLTPAFAIAAPVALVGSAIIAGGTKRSTSLVERELVRLLDQVAAGEVPPSIAAQLRRRRRRTGR
jgi:hypothetical protein